MRKVVNVITLNESEVEAKVQSLKKRGYDVLYTQERPVMTGKFGGKLVTNMGFVTTAIMAE